MNKKKPGRTRRWKGKTVRCHCGSESPLVGRKRAPKDQIPKKLKYTRHTRKTHTHPCMHACMRSERRRREERERERGHQSPAIYSCSKKGRREKRDGWPCGHHATCLVGASLPRDEAGSNFIRGSTRSLIFRQSTAVTMSLLCSEKKQMSLSSAWLLVHSVPLLQFLPRPSGFSAAAGASASAVSTGSFAAVWLAQARTHNSYDYVCTS
jgi:hypothetical protein